MGQSSQSTLDFLISIIAGLDFTGLFTQYADNGDGTFTGTTCNTFYVSDCTSIIINGVEYKVTGFVRDKSITFEAAAMPSEFAFTPKRPVKFYFGPEQQVNTEISHEANGERWPAIYLIEPFDEELNDDEELLVEKTATITLLILDEVNREDWTMSDTKRYLYDPLGTIADELIKAFEKNGRIGDFSTHVRRNHANFGVVQQNRGHDPSILDDKIGGIELQITLPIDKDLNCEFECLKC